MVDPTINRNRQFFSRLSALPDQRSFIERIFYKDLRRYSEDQVRDALRTEGVQVSEDSEDLLDRLGELSVDFFGGNYSSTFFSLPLGEVRPWVRHRQGSTRIVPDYMTLSYDSKQKTFWVSNKSGLKQIYSDPPEVHYVVLSQNNSHVPWDAW